MMQTATPAWMQTATPAWMKSLFEVLKVSLPHQLESERPEGQTRHFTPQELLGRVSRAKTHKSPKESRSRPVRPSAPVYRTPPVPRPRESRHLY